ncbi:fructose PTS transporter subunit IIB [Gracilibacillus sp. S3-1-1]|uniref:Fructose PTS transporter subunit IIB n=1 Tax=Gracilibacillus pellucidus TaxID=3095368 RepID=A0ACC6M0D3_9BACI|nr:fructose PTS transporter subunit IIB [Gracilibacillus sp. S3-1-1]MDX8044363.1 fructose PTS transporter subunit IIB [Gracilibacillus sp. S3-1-1]
MKFVGVTSCIAGLAHTPMAAKSLEKAGVKLGHDVKIEQQGAMGVVNKLEEDDVNGADAIIIAADQSIEGEERFKGKTIIRVKLGQVVSDGEIVLNKIVKAIEAKKS